jgi:hypothetical protein
VPTITLGLPSPGQGVTAGLHSANYAAIQALLNGGLDNSNVLSSASLDAVARVGVRKNSAGSTFNRRRINFIEGSGVTLTVADDSGGEEVDVTIASTSSVFAGVMVWRSAAVSATGTANKISWDNEEFDTDAFHDLVTNPTRLTVPSGKAGKYLVMAHFRMAGTAGAADDRIEIMKNGTVVALESTRDLTALQNFSISEVFDLAVADYIEINAARAGAGTQALSVGQTDLRCSMIKLD